MSLPKRVEYRQPRVRRDLASALRSAVAGLVIPSIRRSGGGNQDEGFHDPELASLRTQLRQHPSHNSPGVESQVREAERYLRIERDNAQLEKKVSAATNSLARTFDRIVGLLTEREFIRGPATRHRSAGSPTTGGCWPASTARAICWSPNACAAARGRI